ncbi:protein of unknown function [Microbacterium sp. Nx66]|nr:protein of unknown function [Microbacterium sp. Nx66]
MPAPAREPPDPTTPTLPALQALARAQARLAFTCLNPRDRLFRDAEGGSGAVGGVHAREEAVRAG